MSEEFYGNGIALDELFDFEVDETGDIRMTGGVSELEKDLSFQMFITLSDLLGSPMTQNFEAKVKDRAKKVALSDSRVESVDDNNIVVREVDAKNDNEEGYELILPVRASNEQQELVFNL